MAKKIIKNKKQKNDPQNPKGIYQYNLLVANI